MDKKEEFGTVTEFFFLTCDLANVSILQTIHTFGENLKIMERYESALKSMNKQHHQCYLFFFYFFMLSPSLFN